MIRDTGCSPEDLLEVITIGKSDERGSGISVLPARHDDDIYIYIYMCVCVCVYVHVCVRVSLVRIQMLSAPQQVHIYIYMRVCMRSSMCA